MSEIQDATFLYRFCRFFVDKVTKHSYRRYQVVGKQNIPEKGYVIWVANHTNALSDALALLASNKKPKVYLARADIFKNPTAAKFLRFLKIMPIYRVRDGLESVKQNGEIIDKCVTVLKSGVPITMFPEGTHQPKHSLLPLSKGVFHIALELEQAKSDDMPVYIQPIGLNYSDFFRYRATCLVNFGRPFNVTEYLEQHKDLDVPKQMLEMRSILTERMTELIAYVPNNTDYDAIWEYAKIKSNNRKYFRHALTQVENDCGKHFNGLERRLNVNRYAIHELLEMQASEPEKTATMLSSIDAFRLWRIQNGISVYSVAKKHSLLRLIKHILLLLLGLPYYLYSIVVASPVWITCLVLMRKTHDDAFYNSIRVGVRISVGAIGFLLWIALLFIFVPYWQYALLGTLLLFPSYMYYTDYHELARITLSDIKWSVSKKRFKHLGFLFE